MHCTIKHCVVAPFGTCAYEGACASAGAIAFPIISQNGPFCFLAIGACAKKCNYTVCYVRSLLHACCLEKLFVNAQKNVMTTIDKFDRRSISCISLIV